MRSLDRHVSVFHIYLWRLVWMSCAAHPRIKGNEQAHRLVGKASTTSGLCLTKSEVLRCLRHDLLAKNITPGGERHTEEEPDNLPWKDKKGPQSIRPTSLFQRQCCKKTSERQCGAFMGLPKPTDTNLNWTDSASKANIPQCMEFGKFDSIFPVTIGSTSSLFDPLDIIIKHTL